MGLLAAVFPALLPAARSHRQSCPELPQLPLRGCTRCWGGGLGGGMRVQTSEVLLVLMGLA